MADILRDIRNAYRSARRHSGDHPHPGGGDRLVYVPMARYDDLTGAAVLADRAARRFHCLLRLRRGVRPEKAEARLAALATSLDREHPWPDGAKRQVTVSRIDAVSFDPETAHMMLVGAVGLLLLACANVANLLLARAAGRRREIAFDLGNTYTVTFTAPRRRGPGAFRIRRRLPGPLLDVGPPQLRRRLRRLPGSFRAVSLGWIG